MNPYFEQFHDQEFSLEELVAAARSTLAPLMPALADGRVAEYPDSRTIRYYQTIGIVHKPSRYEGRNAVYGYQHLLQVVTVKLLQSRGLSLAQIQRALLTSTTADLESVLHDALAKTELMSSQQVPPGREGLYTPWVEIKPKLSDLRDHPLKSLSDFKQTDKGGTKTRDMIATEVAPGVMVILDPQKVANPKTLMARIIRLINSTHGGIE